MRRTQHSALSTQHSSPNHDSRNGSAIDMLVLHYTGMRSGEEALKRLCDPAAKVSAHYMVEEDGRVFALVPEAQRAWHAGKAEWRGQADINARSVGVEIVNPGHEHGYRDFPDAQMESVAALCRDIIARHPIPARNVVAHSDIAPLRKEDPGERFDWARLARAGVGLWPSVNFSIPYGNGSGWGGTNKIFVSTPVVDLAGVTTKKDLLARLAETLHFPDYFGMNWDALDECLDYFFAEHEEIKFENIEALKNLPEADQQTFQEILIRAKANNMWSLSGIANSLNSYGYPLGDGSEDTLRKTITAFQRHFRPRLLDGVWDEECAEILAALLVLAETP